jgi:deazaflavin-dependent oxidoreductase (nitroreductase family)
MEEIGRVSNYKTFGKFHTWLYRASGGLLLGSVGLGRKILLLNTVGRKSGEARTTPLVYMPDGERFVVYGSNGGREAPPAWFLNLQANPRASVEIGRRKIPVSMHVATGEEEARLQPLAHAYNPHWKGYQEKATRRIPLVVLDPSQD